MQDTVKFNDVIAPKVSYKKKLLLIYIMETDKRRLLPQVLKKHMVNYSRKPTVIIIKKNNPLK